MSHICKIQSLEAIKRVLKEAGFTFRIRYRGPRPPKVMYDSKTGLVYWRGKQARQQDCLKEDATGFRYYITGQI